MVFIYILKCLWSHKEVDFSYVMFTNNYYSKTYELTLSHRVSHSDVLLFYDPSNTNNNIVTAKDYDRYENVFMFTIINVLWQ